MATCFPLLLLQLGKSRTNFQQPPIVSEFVNAALSMKAICIISLVAISTQRYRFPNIWSIMCRASTLGIPTFSSPQQNEWSSTESGILCTLMNLIGSASLCQYWRRYHFYWIRWLHLYGPPSNLCVASQTIFFFFCLDVMLQFKRRKSSTLFEFLFRLWESASSWWISDFVTTCAVLTVNVQMVVGGCRLTLFARALCNLATTSRLAEQHFNWSHFCQTRQAKTHLRIQGVPADTHPPARTHYSDDIPGNLLISREHWRSSPRLIGFFHNSDQRLNKRRFQALFTLS